MVLVNSSYQKLVILGLEVPSVGFVLDPSISCLIPCIKFA